MIDTTHAFTGIPDIIHDLRIKHLRLDRCPVRTDNDFYAQTNHLCPEGADPVEWMDYLSGTVRYVSRDNPTKPFIVDWFGIGEDFGRHISQFRPESVTATEWVQSAVSVVRDPEDREAKAVCPAVRAWLMQSYPDFMAELGPYEAAAFIEGFESAF